MNLLDSRKKLSTTQKRVKLSSPVACAVCGEIIEANEVAVMIVGNKKPKLAAIVHDGQCPDPHADGRRAI